MTIDPMVFAAAAVIVIGAIATAAVKIINALSSLRTSQAAIMAKAEVIQGHVDGMQTAAAAKRTSDEDTITGLRKQLTDSETRASMLAQSKSNADVSAQVKKQTHK